MSIDRRNFLASAAMAGTSVALPNQFPGSSNGEPGEVIHHVFFWLKRPGSVEDRAKLQEGLATLRAVKTIKKLVIGLPAATMQRGVVDNSFDVSELMWFANAADQDAYQSDPIHLAFVEKYSSLWDKVVVHDMVVAG